MQRSTTTGTVSYLEPPANGEGPWVYTYKRDGKEQINFTRSETQVDVHDMREVQDSFTLRDKGIELHKLEVPSDLDWENEKEVSLTLYRQACMT